MLEGSIDVTSMPYLYDEHYQLIIFNGIHDSVFSVSDAISIITGQLLAPRRPGVLSKCLNLSNDALAIFFRRDSEKLFPR